MLPVRSIWVVIQEAAIQQVVAAPADAALVT